MEKLSDLCKIMNPPSNPFELFQRFLNDYQKYVLPPVITMNLATVNRKYSVLNRTVVYRGLKDDNTVIFITERNTQKYKDIQENPKVAATFLFIYNRKEQGVVEQVRFNGTAIELCESDIEKFWNEESIYAKIRSRICECGKPVDWDELKRKHDEILKAYEEGKDKLNKTDTYTAFKIVPDLIDFYYSTGMAIADRIRYNKDDTTNTWTNTRVCT